MDNLEFDATLIGKGGFGTVYKAVLKSSGKTIAVKQIDTDGMTKDQINGIKGEIETMKELSHANIISYLGTMQKPNKILIFLEFADRGSLRQFYQTRGKLDEPTTKYCLAQILCGLYYLHSNGIAHRDIKCANFLLSGDGKVMLADFGSSKKFESESIISGLKGTPHWMAPEVIKGTQMTTGWIKADVWSLGCAVVEMVTGRVPYSEYENSMTAMYKIASGELPNFGKTTQLSNELQSFLKSCFALNPDERPSALDLIENPSSIVSKIFPVTNYDKLIFGANIPLISDTASAKLLHEKQPSSLKHRLLSSYSELGSGDLSTQLQTSEDEATLKQSTYYVQPNIIPYVLDESQDDSVSKLATSAIEEKESLVTGNNNDIIEGLSQSLSIQFDTIQNSVTMNEAITSSIHTINNSNFDPFPYVVAQMSKNSNKMQPSVDHSVIKENENLNRVTFPNAIEVVIDEKKEGNDNFDVASYEIKASRPPNSAQENSNRSPRAKKHCLIISPDAKPRLDEQVSNITINATPVKPNEKDSQIYRDSKLDPGTSQPIILSDSILPYSLSTSNVDRPNAPLTSEKLLIHNPDNNDQPNFKSGSLVTPQISDLLRVNQKSMRRLEGPARLNVLNQTRNSFANISSTLVIDGENLTAVAKKNLSHIGGQQIKGGFKKNKVNGHSSNLLNNIFATSKEFSSVDLNNGLLQTNNLLASTIKRNKKKEVKLQLETSIDTFSSGNFGTIKDNAAMDFNSISNGKVAVNGKLHNQLLDVGKGNKVRTSVGKSQAFRSHSAEINKNFNSSADLSGVHLATDECNEDAIFSNDLQSSFSKVGGMNGDLNQNSAIVNVGSRLTCRLLLPPVQYRSMDPKSFNDTGQASFRFVQSAPAVVKSLNLPPLNHVSINQPDKSNSFHLYSMTPDKIIETSSKKMC